MSSQTGKAIRDAVILAAGNGDRFRSAQDRSKLLHAVRGRPLILRAVDTAISAGIERLHIILGFDADQVRTTVERHGPPGVPISFAHNDRWQLENGISALKARALCDRRPFALLMGDHLFDASILRRLAQHPSAGRTSLLAVDTIGDDPEVVAEATRVRLDGAHIVDIGKAISPWDGLDMGVFVFTPELFGALQEAQREGDTTLSAGVRRLARRGLMLGVAIGNSRWCDVDTIADLHTAEALLEEEPEHE